MSSQYLQSQARKEERSKVSHFYKYRSLSGPSKEWTIRILTDNKLYFSNPKHFNDPFDCRPIYSLACTNDEYQSYITRLVNSREPSPEGRRELLASFAKPGMRDKLVQNLEANQEASIMDAVGICSLSATPENVLMWSHYADEHRGICFQFNASAFRPFFGRAQPVTYQRMRPVCNRITNSDYDNLKAVLLTKATEWSYEQEWRIVDHDLPAGPRQFPPEDLLGVVLGYRITDSDELEIMNLIKTYRPNVVVYKAAPHHTQFKVTLNQIWGAPPRKTAPN